MKAEMKAWEREKKFHLGDYGDSSEFDLMSAFIAGYRAGRRKEKYTVSA